MSNNRVRQRAANYDNNGNGTNGHDAEKGEHHKHSLHLPHKGGGGSRLPREINPAGESGRSGIHPILFFKAVFKSSSAVSAFVNILWPFAVPAIVLHFARPGLHKAIFATNFLAMIPAANLLGYAGQELARKVPKVFGVILETFLGSIVELILLAVLLAQSTPEGSTVPIIRDAILGSILANLLLCLGLCFFIGGLRRESQQFSGAVSEVGSGLLLVAGFGLAVPKAFEAGISSQADFYGPSIDAARTQQLITYLTRGTAICLILAYLIYVWFQMRSHHGLYDSVLELDEQKDEDGHKDRKKLKLTLTESILAIVLALTLVSMFAVFLVLEIEPILEESHGGLSEVFMGLILVPLVEKVSEHLTAMDEAWDNQMNFALVHVLGSSLQTALLNAPVIVLAGWGKNIQMDFNFNTFQIILLILAIIVLGNFIRDRESNYLEGALCILVYIIIAVAAWYFPNRPHEEPAAEGAEAAAEAARRLVKMAMA